MDGWEIDKEKRPGKTKGGMLISGLPGIGNCGKIAVDFIIDQKRAGVFAEYFSNRLPSSVFVNDDGLIELPLIRLSHIKNKKGKDIYLLSGDSQPVDEIGTFTLCETLVGLCKEQGIDNILTLGGIGQQNIPKSPKVYCTGSSKTALKDYEKIKGLRFDIQGVVGPILGTAGVLPALAERDGILGAALLAETYGHPFYLGLPGAKQLLKKLKLILELDIDIKQIDKEIKEMQKELLITQETKEASKKKSSGPFKDTSYIG